MRVLRPLGGEIDLRLVLFLQLRQPLPDQQLQVAPERAEAAELEETGRPEQLLSDFPYLQREDVVQALSYSAWLADE